MGCGPSQEQPSALNPGEAPPDHHMKHQRDLCNCNQSDRTGGKDPNSDVWCNVGATSPPTTVMESSQCVVNPSESERRAARALEISTGVYTGAGSLWRKHKQNPSYYTLEALEIVDKKMMFEQCAEDVSFIKEINEEFARSVDKHTKVMQRAIEQKSLHSVFEEAHALKGASANLGLQRLTAVCLELEMLARHATSPSGQGASEEVLTELTYYLNVLKAQYKIYTVEFGKLTWP